MRYLKKIICGQLLIALFIASLTFASNPRTKAADNLDNIQTDGASEAGLGYSGPPWPMFRNGPSRTGSSASEAPETDYVVWESTLLFHHPPGGSSPAVADGRLYIGTKDGWLYCLDAITGEMKWRWDTTKNKRVGSPTVADGRVYFGDDTGTLYCLDASNGDPFCSPNHDGAGTSTFSPLVANGKVYSPAYFGSWYMGEYDALTLTLTRPFVFDDTGDRSVEGGAALVDGMLYVTTQFNNVVCWDTDSPYGAPHTYHTGNDPISQLKCTPIVYNDKVYVTKADGHVYMLSLDLSFSYVNYVIDGPIRSSAAAADGKLFVAGDKLYCLPAMLDTPPLWVRSIGYAPDGTESSPVFADGKVYVGSKDGCIYCYYATSGELVWAHDCSGEALVSSPAIAYGRVYVGSGESLVGLIIAIGPDQWPMFRHDKNHSGYSTYTVNHGGYWAWSLFEDRCDFHWRDSWSADRWVLSSPVVAYNRVYVHRVESGYDLSREWLDIYDALTQETEISDISLKSVLLKTYDEPIALPNVISSPAVAYGKVYVGSEEGKLYCRDAITGEPVWEGTDITGPVRSSPTVDNECVYVGSDDGRVYSYWAKIAVSPGPQLRWAFDTYADYAVRASPAVVDDHVYVPSTDGYLYCINVADGTQWCPAVNVGSAMRSSPTVADGRLYVGADNNNVYCFDVSGDTIPNEPKWTFTTDGGVESSPAVASDKVYIGSRDWKVYCIDAFTGQKMNEYRTGSSIYSSPAIADGKVFVGSQDGFVYCLLASALTEIWKCYVGIVTWQSPAIVEGKLYISSEGGVYAFKFGSYSRWKTWRHGPLGDGWQRMIPGGRDDPLNPLAPPRSPMWRYQTGGAVYSSPAVVDEKVFIGSLDRSIYCIDASTGDEVWKYTTSGAVWSSPAVVDGKVYVGSNDTRVYCLDASNGSPLWNYTTGFVVRSSPAVVDGSVYIGSLDGKLYCLNASTGAPIWNYTTGAAIYSSPAVGDGKVYVGSFDNKMYCLNASNGAFIWSYTTGSAILSTPSISLSSAFNGYSSRVYVGSMDNRLYCLNASTGAPIWNYTTGNAIESSPAIGYGKVYFGSNDGKVYCLNATSKATIWIRNTTVGPPSGAVRSSPAIIANMVYVGSDDGKLYCFNASTGSSIWNYATSYAFRSSPALVDYRIFIGSYDGNVYAFGPEQWPMLHHDRLHSGYAVSSAPNTNHTAWTYTTGDAVSSSPAVVDLRVYIGSTDHKVYCLNAQTGTTVWTYLTQGDVTSSPAVAYGRVYVGSSDYIFYCLDALNGTLLWQYVAGGQIIDSPTVADYHVYFGSYDDGRIYRLDALTGAYKWSYLTGGSIESSSPAFAEDKVYIGSNDHKVYCLNASTGLPIWTYTTGSSVRCSPTITENKVYIGSDDNKVYCLAASNGAYIWSYTTGSSVESTPAVAFGNIYVGSYDHKIYCLNALTGIHIWNYTTGDAVYSSPAAADGKVYVGSLDTKVYCLNASTGAKIWNYTTNAAVHSSPAVAYGRVYVGANNSNVYAFGLTHKIAVANAKSIKTVVGQSMKSPLNITLANNGAFIETFNVTIYANATRINQTELTLGSLESRNLIVHWNTTNFSKGMYTIRIFASAVPGEIDVADNLRIAGDVMVTLAGDVNGDKKVDGRDIAIIAKYFGSTGGYPPEADINSDGKVDGRDIAIAAKNFGQIWT